MCGGPRLPAFGRTFPSTTSVNSLSPIATKPTTRLISKSAILSVTAFAVLPMAVFAPMGLAPLAFASAVGLLASHGRGPLLAAVPPWLSAGLAAFGILGTLSATWAIDPSVSLYKAGQLLFIFAAGVILYAGARAAAEGEAARARIGAALLAGTAAAAALLLVERYMGMPLSALIKPWPAEEAAPLFRLNRASALFAILSFPAAWISYRCWGAVPALLAIAVSLFVVLSLGSTAAGFGLVLGLMVAVAVHWAPRVAPQALAVGLVLSSLAAPLAASAMLETPPVSTSIQHLQPSAYHRLLIWNFASQRIAERPLLGWGLDSSRAIPQGHGDAKLPSDAWAQGELLPLHPHNAALQIWLELGLVGLLLACALVAVPIWRAGRQFADGWALAAALGSVTAISVVAFASFGIWQSWWLCAIWIAISLCIAIMGGDGKSATVVTSRPQTHP